MIKGFEQLDDSEKELVLKAPLLVCILVAGADGRIDRKEIKGALSVAQKQNGIKPVLAGFFKEMAQDFEDKLRVVMQSYPHSLAERTERITEDLSKVSLLWHKLPNEFALAYYEMLKILAKRIASSSGGLLGINAIGAEEARYLNLPMIADPSV